MPTPPQAAPEDVPLTVPEAPPMTDDVPELIPVPDPKGVPATEEFAAPEIISGDGPAYMTTEQPKRVADFKLDQTDSSETAAKAERAGTDEEDE